MSHFIAKMHQIRFPASVRPSVHSSLKRSLTLIEYFNHRNQTVWRESSQVSCCCPIGQQLLGWGVFLADVLPELSRCRRLIGWLLIEQEQC